MEIFNHYFSTTHLNNDVYEMDGSDVFGSLNNDAMKGKNQRKPFPPKNVEVTVKCSLQEFYNGSMKTVRYTFD